MLSVSGMVGAAWLIRNRPKRVGSDSFATTATVNTVAAATTKAAKALKTAAAAATWRPFPAFPFSALTPLRNAAYPSLALLFPLLRAIPLPSFSVRRVSLRYLCYTLFLLPAPPRARSVLCDASLSSSSLSFFLLIRTSTRSGFANLGTMREAADRAETGDIDPQNSMRLRAGMLERRGGPRAHAAPGHIASGVCSTSRRIPDASAPRCLGIGFHVPFPVLCCIPPMPRLRRIVHLAWHPSSTSPPHRPRPIGAAPSYFLPSSTSHLRCATSCRNSARIPPCSMSRIYVAFPSSSISPFSYRFPARSLHSPPLNVQSSDSYSYCLLVSLPANPRFFSLSPPLPPRRKSARSSTSRSSPRAGYNKVKIKSAQATAAATDTSSLEADLATE
ncbi:hypothetical protein C8R44DRAFT_895016 [Mycena epipterygia]|nr:hypothetical protein C8R44DRAFT_895016 [Mycena epipterygia]